MKAKLIFTLVLVLSLLPIVRGQNKISDLSVPPLTPIEEIRSHYAELNKLNDQSSHVRRWMDTIRYPENLYHDHTILYTLINPVYLKISDVNWLAQTLKFPKNSSEQTRAELDFLLKLQNERTPQQEKRVMELAKVGYWPGINKVESHPHYQKNEEYLFFEIQEILGDNYNVENFPATSQLLKGIMNDMRLMEFTVKYKYLRARPYHLEPKIKPLREIQSPSFASGHTLWAYIQAYTLGELIPEKRKAFIELAYEIGLSREIMGVHYPSDEEVARVLAHKMLSIMWNSKKYQQDFTKAKQEWEQANF